MKLVVTGGSGFLGSFVVPLLVAHGHGVYALTRSGISASKVSALGATAAPADLDDPCSVEVAFAKSEAEALVNLASLGFGHAPAIVSAAEKAGIDRCLFVSTTAIFTSLDVRSRAIRLAAEDAIRASSLSWTIVRPTMIYGATGDRNMSRLLRALLHWPMFPLPDGGTNLQQPVHVADLADALCACLSTTASIRQTYNVAGPDSLTLSGIVDQAALAVGRRPVVFRVPLSPAKKAVGVYERFARRPRIRAEQLERLTEDKVFDIQGARHDLGYSPRSFAVGIAEEAASMMVDRASRRHGVLLLAGTVRHLHPTQIGQRLRLRGQRQVCAFRPSLTARVLQPHRVEAKGWPQKFIPLDSLQKCDAATAAAYAEGRFSFLNSERKLGDPADWLQVTAPQLWRYHLHYFDWAWKFAGHPDRDWSNAAFQSLLRSWRQANPVGRGDAWAPYVVSVRGWTFCGVFAHLIAGTEAEDWFIRDLAVHARYLKANVELDVGGNHLIKNIKALVGLGLFLGEDSIVRAGAKRLQRELQCQTLADGGHYERSPSYHCQVLGDLIDLRDLVESVDAPLGPYGLDEAVGELDCAISAMRGWLGQMVMPDGDVPLFNDCVMVGAERLALLGVKAEQDQVLTVLEPSGYAVVRHGEAQLVIDIGPPCPPTLPAHAHADCLSFELAVGGNRVVVDTGTSTYEPGPRRQYERSTAAHNTVDVDSADQTEVWGTFRAARRANPRVELIHDLGDHVELVATHDGYERLDGKPVHWRRLLMGRTELRIIDEVVGAGSHSVRGHLHVPFDEISTDGRRLVAGTVVIEVKGGNMSVVDAEVASAFGRRERGKHVIVSAAGRLPVKFETSISWG